MNTISYAQLKKTATRTVKKNQNSFINIIRDKFALAISFCKKLFGCINYLQLLTLSMPPENIRKPLVL